jgi:hypothetical protein
LIDFGDVQMGDMNQRRKVIIHNTQRSATGVLVECVAHPTGQVGSPQDTYEAALLSFDSEGPFVSNSLLIGIMSPGEAKEVWVKWPIDMDALPGWGVFALKVTGTVNL